GNLRRRGHDALVTEALDLPIESVAGRAGLVAKRQTLVLGGKLPHQLRRCSLRIVDLAEKPHLARPTAICNRHCITQLRGIETHKSFTMIAHDSPSLFEALPGLPG